MAMKIKMKNILGALGALALVLGAGPAPAAEAFKAGLVEVFAQREGHGSRASWRARCSTPRAISGLSLIHI